MRRPEGYVARQFIRQDPRPIRQSIFEYRAHSHQEILFTGRVDIAYVCPTAGNEIALDVQRDEPRIAELCYLICHLCIAYGRARGPFSIRVWG
jgi:hypothetical protein